MAMVNMDITGASVALGLGLYRNAFMVLAVATHGVDLTL
jgi:hypothetical protein